MHTQKNNARHSRDLNTNTKALQVGEENTYQFFYNIDTVKSVLTMTQNVDATRWGSAT